MILARVRGTYDVRRFLDANGVDERRIGCATAETWAVETGEGEEARSENLSGLMVICRPRAHMGAKVDSPCDGEMHPPRPFHDSTAPLFWFRNRLLFCTLHRDTRVCLLLCGTVIFSPTNSAE